MTQHNPHLTTTPDPERGTIAERLARIDKFAAPGIYTEEKDRAEFTTQAICGTPYARVTLTYGRRYDRRHVGMDTLSDDRHAVVMHVLLDEVEADLGIFAPATMDAEVAA